MSYKLEKKLNYQRFFTVVNLLLGLFIVSFCIWFIIDVRAPFYVGNNVVIFVDFLYYYVAGKIYLSNDYIKIYDMDAQQQIFTQLMDYPVEKLVPYLYPPQTLLFFIPLSYFSLGGGLCIWRIFNIILTFMFPMMLRYCGVSSDNKTMLYIAVSLIILSFPWLLNTYHGQVNIVILLGLWGGYLLIQKDRFLLASLLIMITAFKPQLFVIPILYFLTVYGVRMWLNITIAFIVTIISCSLIFGFDVWIEYIKTLSFASSRIHSGTSVESMGNFRALFLLIFGREYFPYINLASIAIWIVGMIASVIIGFLFKNKSAKMIDFGFALCVSISCFFNPWIHIYSFILLLIPIAYLVKYVQFRPVFTYIAFIFCFNFLALLINSLKSNLNSLLWLPTQFVLLYIIIYQIRKLYMQSSVES
ncbi:MAG: glycosyltransferase family 87 protein [Rickettsiales bacterium]